MTTEGSAIVLRGDALHMPLPDNSVDLIITSPPYFALRSYRDEGEHYAGQIGSESTPQEFLQALWAATREMKRVLKPTGSMWINLGDRYSGSGMGGNMGLANSDEYLKERSSQYEESKWTTLAKSETTPVAKEQSRDRSRARIERARTDFVKPKSLMGLPWRYAIGCIDDLGLILRAEIVWSKPNGLPESVTDRVRRSHEQWFHFVKEPKYFAAMDEIREAYAPASEQRFAGPAYTSRVPTDSEHRPGSRAAGWNGYDISGHPLGKMPGSVWTIEEQGDVTWIGSIGICQRCNGVRVAGSGLDDETEKVTASTGLLTEETDALTELPMNSGLAESQADSPSTISVETRDASTQPILSPSPLERTFLEVTLQRLGIELKQLASMDTRSLLRILISVAMEDESAACVCETECASDGPGSVWSVPSEPLIVPQWAKDKYNLPDHFAAFPQEWPRRLILGWSPSGVCEACGEGRRPVVDKSYLSIGDKFRGGLPVQGRHDSGKRMGDGVEATITGYACACKNPLDDVRRRIDGLPMSLTAETKPAVVLDPFGGTGTVAMVARALNRTGVSLDLGMDYSRLAQWRIFKSGHGAKAASRTNKERQTSFL